MSSHLLSIFSDPPPPYTATEQLYSACLRLKAHTSYLFDELNDILVLEQVVFANFLRVVLDGRTPHQRVLELLHNALVNAVAEVRDLHEQLKSGQT